MEGSVQQLRELLRLASSLRTFAEDASPDYARKLLHAANDLEMRAQFLADHRPDEIPPDPEREAVLHAPVDIRI
jgi:hypothetical protein